jgi:hypothetical protein
MTEDFVIPLMYLRGHLVGPAWREFSRRFFAGNVGSIVLFYLMRIVVGMAAGMIVLIGTCVTCCLAALPTSTRWSSCRCSCFTRAYSLYFLRQFGPQ